jgi:hypothetical protein
MSQPAHLLPSKRRCGQNLGRARCDSARLVGKLRAARERKRTASGKCEGRKAWAEINRGRVLRSRSFRCRSHRNAPWFRCTAGSDRGERGARRHLRGCFTVRSRSAIGTNRRSPHNSHDHELSKRSAEGLTVFRSQTIQHLRRADFQSLINLNVRRRLRRARQRHPSLRTDSFAPTLTERAPTVPA